MSARNTATADRRAQSALQKAKYAPKPSALPKPQVVSLQDARLRRLTARVLDDLKRPGAIPSNVILAALKEAQAS